jgi:FtsP/CotA-like multicopper oxidase with cupredoxin domain
MHCMKFRANHETKGRSTARPRRGLLRALALGAVLLACGEAGHDGADDDAKSTPSALTACGGDAIQAPPRFQWTFHPAGPGNPEPYYSGTLEVGEADFVIGGRTLKTRAYRQAGAQYTIPGPTITMAPGNKYVLRFANTLPFQAIDHHRHNVFKDANIANIHTHGLHISGE